LLDAEFCLDPGIGIGAIPRCIGNATRTVVVSGQAVAASATFLAPNYTGSLAAISVDLTTATATTLALASARFSAAGTSAQYNGLAWIVLIKIYPATASAGDESVGVTAMKRIVFSSAARATKNTNPSGLEIREAGTEIAALPGSDSTLTAFLPSNQGESYSEYNIAGALLSKNETIETTWFLTGPEDAECARKKDCTTDGLFKLSRSRINESNVFFAPKVSTPSTRGRVLIAIARDGRGGQMVKRYCTGTCP
jgi:hypothetical protein